MQASPRPRGAGIPTGSKGTLGFIFFELQSRNVQESRTWLILCREAPRPRREEEKKAGNKQSRRRSWLTAPSQILHPPVLRTAVSGPGAAPCCHGGGSCLLIPLLPRLCPGSASGQIFVCGRGNEAGMEEPGCDLEDPGSSLLPPPLSPPMCTLGLLQVPPLSPFLLGCSPPGCPFSSHDGEAGSWRGQPHPLTGIPGWHREIGSSVGHKGLLRTSPQPWHARCPSPPSRACHVLPGSCLVSGVFFNLGGG